MPQYARAKQEIINFLNKAPKDENKLYAFVLPLQSKKEAGKFIHRMRVELSRLRDEFKKQGIQLRPFKVMLKGITNTDTSTTITLRYQDSNCAVALEDINNLFDILATKSHTIDENKARGKTPINL